MFIVAESGSAIFNVDTSTIISIYKFKASDEEKWAVCCDYSADDETYHLLTNKTENREVAVAAMERITEAIKNDVKLLDLSEVEHPLKCTNCGYFAVLRENDSKGGYYYAYCCCGRFNSTRHSKDIPDKICKEWTYGNDNSQRLELLEE